MGPTWLVGDGAERYREVLAAASSLATFAGPAGNAPDPEVLVAAAAAAAYGFSPVEPLYLRPSDAEENLTAIAAGRGLSPDTARERLRRALRRA